MKLSLRTKISFGITFFTSIALIVIGAMLVRYKVDPSGSLFFIIGILLSVVGFTTGLNYISGRQKGAKVLDYVISVVVIISGILIALYSQEFQAYGLVIIGVLFISLAVYDFLSYIRSRSVMAIVFGVMRIIVGIAFIASGFSETLTSADSEFATSVWLALGYLSLIFGIAFLVFETFIGEN